MAVASGISMRRQPFAGLPFFAPARRTQAGNAAALAFWACIYYNT